MNHIMKRFVPAAVIAAMLSSYGCASAADYSDNTGTIELSTMSVTGKGISVSDNIVSITEGGDFTVTGEAEDAMIYINASDKVKLRLSGMSLTNTSGPAIFFDDAEKALITITENTENYLSDGADYSVDAKAALFSNDDLEIKGKGTLTIVGNYKHGIASDDDLKIENGTINITANVKDGMHANDDIEISGGNITISSEKQGIQAEQNFILSGGNVVIEKSTEGVESGASIIINGGEIDITASDDGLNSGGGIGAGDDPPGGGMMRGEFDSDSTPPPMPDGEEFGGRGMDGRQMPPDGQTPPDGGEQFGGRGMGGRQMPPEGREQFDGQMPPDGFEERGDNSRGGRGMGGGPMETTIDDGVDRNLYINGGVIRINAEGDGVDSNADIIMTGGELYIDGPTSNGDGAIDGSSFIVSGGTVVAVGSSGMAMGLSQGSSQCGILVNTEQIPAGTLLELKGGETTLMSYTNAKNISSIVYSSDKLAVGGEYTLYAGGEEIETISMTSAQVTIGGRGFGGPGGMGGGRGGRGMISVTNDDGEVNVNVNAQADGDSFLKSLQNVLGKLGMTVERTDENALGFRIKF